MLGNSEYGRFFIRKLDLWGLERRPEEWKQAQSGVKARRTSDGLKSQIMDSEEHRKGDEVTGKRRKGIANEIDELFAGVEVKKRKKG